MTFDRGGGGADPTASYYADTNLDWPERDEPHQPSTTSITTTGASVSGGGAYREGAGEREEGPRGGGGGVFGRLSEDGEEGEGSFVIEPSPGSTPQPAELEDGEGGYIVDPSMISNSPIRCFTRLSEMDPQESAWYKDQFKGKGRGRGRGGGGGGGKRQLPMTREERESATWGRDDFGDLFGTGGW